MTTKWRPEGWENPYYSHSNGDSLMSINQALDEPYKHKTYEAGADAMLEAMRMRIKRAYESTPQAVDRLGGKGRWVFIPEEAVNA